MTHASTNGPWIVAQLIRIRTLENEIKDLFSIEMAPKATIQSRVDELKSQVALLDLALN